MCPKNQFNCDECTKTFATNYKLNRHIKAVHRKERPFVCSNCDKSFVENHILTKHKLKAHGIQPEEKAKGPKPKIRPVCDECGQDFCDKSKLSRHIKTRHNYEYPFSCNECSKSFRDGPR